jgi:hypothetical protein
MILHDRSPDMSTGNFTASRLRNNQKISPHASFKSRTRVAPRPGSYPYEPHLHFTNCG